MRKIITCIALGLTGCCILPCLAHAGAWTVPQGKFYHELYSKYFYAKEQFDNDRDRGAAHNKGFKQHIYSFEYKIEYGITDRVNFLFSLPYDQSYYKEYERPVDWGTYVHKSNGLKDISIGTKIRLFEKFFVFSGQAKYFFNPDYDPMTPAISKGDQSLEVRGLISKAFELPIGYKDAKLPAYFNFEAGYRWRNKHVPNGIPLFTEIGVYPVKWFLMKSELDFYKSHPGTASLALNEDYLTWRIGGTFLIFGNSTLRHDNLFNIEVLYGRTLAGKNTPAGQEVVIKVQHEF